jgi:hypothetical protein
MIAFQDDPSIPCRCPLCRTSDCKIYVKPMTRINDLRIVNVFIVCRVCEMRAAVAVPKVSLDALLEDGTLESSKVFETLIQ